MMYKILIKKLLLLCISVLLVYAPSLYARDVNISRNLSYIDVEYKNNIIRLERNQDTKNTLKGGFTKTSRNCPPFCIHPMHVSPEIETVGELEVIDFIALDVKQGSGVLIDARTPGWHKKGTIPGSINIPFTTFALDPTDKELRGVMSTLGVMRKSSANEEDSFWGWMSDEGDNNNKNWDFSNAKDVIVWCNGMWCDQSPRAIKSLLKHGYPAHKLKYFRGGMQTWLILGLTVVKP